MRAPSSLALFGAIALIAYTVGCGGSNGNVPAGKPTTAPVTPTPVATPTPTPVPSMSPTPFHTPTPIPSTTPTPTYTQLTHDYSLTSSGETITFPPDGDATGNSKVPAVNLSVELDFTESNTLIAGSPKASHCSQPVYWYSTLFLDGPVSNPSTFASSDIPVTFTSPALITAGHKYGLCVIMGDASSYVIIQDDFTTSPGGASPVSPNGDSVDLTIVLPSYFEGTFPNQTTASVYFEKQ